MDKFKPQIELGDEETNVNKSVEHIEENNRNSSLFGLTNFILKNMDKYSE